MEEPDCIYGMIFLTNRRVILVLLLHNKGTVGLLLLTNQVIGPAYYYTIIERFPEIAMIPTTWWKSFLPRGCFDPQSTPPKKKVIACCERPMT